MKNHLSVTKSVYWCESEACEKLIMRMAANWKILEMYLEYGRVWSSQNQHETIQILGDNLRYVCNKK